MQYLRRLPGQLVNNNGKIFVFIWKNTKESYFALQTGKLALKSECQENRKQKNLIIDMFELQISKRFH